MSVIRPVVTFGSETWVMDKHFLEIVKIWKRKVIQKIFGVFKEIGDWKRRANGEVRQGF